MDGLNVHVSSQMNQELNRSRIPDKIKDLFSGPKVVFTILGIVILAEVIYAAKVLTAPTPVPYSPPARKAVVSATRGGRISLTVPKANFAVNEIVPVTVVVDSGSHTIDGVDLIVQYDPKVMTVTTGGLTKGNILDEYPLIAADASKGLISISGISKSGSGFKGTGQFAVINLRAKEKGKTSLMVYFQKGSTANSNLVETSTSKNILEQVDNLNIIIQ